MGYPVFPCLQGGKQPATEHGLHDATTDPAQIDKWWGENPLYNVAINTSGFVVLDVDGADNGWPGDPDLAMSLCGPPIATTAGGGSHRWFIDPYPAVHRHRNTTGKLAPKVDTRADGGYVIIPPSRIDGSGVYQWVPGAELEEPSRLEAPPDWMLDLLGSKPAAPSAASADSPIPDGQRNATLARLGGGMRRMGMGESEIRAALRAANQSRCNPPLDEREVDKVAWSVSRYEPDQCSQAIIEGWADGLLGGPDADTVAMLAGDRLSDPGGFPAELLDVGGILGDVIKFNLAGAFRPQPVLALAGAISLMAVLTGRKVQDSRGTRTNLYAVGVAPSGAGKERARQVNKNILLAAGLERIVGPESFGSHAGIITAIDSEPCTLFQIDEFGRYIATVGDPMRSMHLYKTIDVLLKLYSSSSSLYIGDAYADKKNVKRINEPHACMYGTTVPKSLYESLSADSLTDGFLGRLFIFEGDKAPSKQSPEVMDVPEDLATRVKAWGEWLPGGNMGDLSGGKPSPHTAEDGPGAVEVFTEFEDLFDRETFADRAGLGAVWCRAGEKARKLALVHACSDCELSEGELPTINRVDAEWGCALTVYLTQWLARLSVNWISETPFQRRCNQLLRVITAAPDGVTGTQLAYKTRAISGREREEAIKQLTESGMVQTEVENPAGRGRPRTIYRATKA